MPTRDRTENSLSVMYATWNFQMARTCVDTKCDTRASNPTNAAFARKDSLERITWPSISRRTRKACRIIAPFVTEDSNVRSQCEPTSRTNMLASTTSSKLAPCVVIARPLWKVYEFTSLIGKFLFWIISHCFKIQPALHAMSLATVF